MYSENHCMDNLSLEDVEAYKILGRYFRPGRLALLAQLVELLCTDSGADGLSIAITNRRVESIKLRKAYKSDSRPE